MAVRTLNEFQNSDYVVVPSGSCSAMIRVFYLDLFEDDPTLLAQAESLSRRVYEFSEFLVNVLGVEAPGVEGSGSAVFHPGCHLLAGDGGEGCATVPAAGDARPGGERNCEMRKPVADLAAASRSRLPHISEGMLRDKVSAVRDSGADTLVSCDMSCLMHIGGALQAGSSRR